MDLRGNGIGIKLGVDIWLQGASIGLASRIVSKTTRRRGSRPIHSRSLTTCRYSTQIMCNRVETNLSINYCVGKTKNWLIVFSIGWSTTPTRTLKTYQMRPMCFLEVGNMPCAEGYMYYMYM